MTVKFSIRTPFFHSCPIQFSMQQVETCFKTKIRLGDPLFTASNGTWHKISHVALWGPTRLSPTNTPHRKSPPYHFCPSSSNTKLISVIYWHGNGHARWTKQDGTQSKNSFSPQRLLSKPGRITLSPPSVIISGDLPMPEQPHCQILNEARNQSTFHLIFNECFSWFATTSPGASSNFSDCLWTGGQRTKAINLIDPGWSSPGDLLGSFFIRLSCITSHKLFLPGTLTLAKVSWARSFQESPSPASSHGVEFTGPIRSCLMQWKCSCSHF